MGNNKSSVSRSESTRVLVVGLHDSGKSHFIRAATCDTLTEDADRPTFGLYEASTVYRRRRITFCEMPPSSVYLLPDQPPPAVIVWFVDGHDTLTEVYDGRNIFLHAVSFVASSSSSSSKGERRLLVRPRLCLVQNIGRPHPVRRRVAHGQYLKEPCSRGKERPVEWDQLLEIFTEACKDDAKGAFATQISYKHADAPLLFMDWLAGFI